MILRICLTVGCLTLQLPLPADERPAADAANETDTANKTRSRELVTIPDAWRDQPEGRLAPVNGYSWYRALVAVPSSWADAELTLFVEALDDARAAFVNGTRVGATGTFPPRYRSGLGESGRYRVAAELIRAGHDNVISIRVYQNDPRPNFSVAPPVLINEARREGLRLAGQWQYHPADTFEFAHADRAEFIAGADTKTPLTARGIYSQIDVVKDVDRYARQRMGDRDPLSPQAAEAMFVTPDDLRVQLVLSEPEISQPLFMTWDERGRLWLVEYRQYPELAGSRMVSRDVYLRTVYDRIPEAPPHGPRGRDRISIHEDTTGDGVYDTHQIFADGLNIATSVAPGRGGAFVTNPPYLLFIPDKDGDDVPDGDPQVLLEGFGLEDLHSVVNSLRFGPDGWLYGAQGSTVTGRIKRPGSSEKPVETTGQQIWRYHPETRRFEVFAQGGGNTFGVEIDSRGRIYSGHNGGNTRGFHYVQGGYYRKGVGKHGPLSNPYAFGYFPSMKHHDVPRFTHNFVIYEEDLLPSAYRGKLFGIEPLQGQVVMSHMRPWQSSFETEDISRVVRTEDPWFRPVDIKSGPDGAIYIADMYEQRIDHSSHYAGRIDRSNGRIYRIVPATDASAAAGAKASDDFSDPVKSVTHPARWHRQTANRLIGDQSHGHSVSELLRQTLGGDGQTALESLWALHLAGGLDDAVALKTLEHADEHVRAWTVRLLCDQNSVSSDIATALARVAAHESSIHARKQLASSARRLSIDQGLPVVLSLLSHDDDADDLHQPLLLWWALERYVTDGGSSAVIDRVFGADEVARQPLVREHLAGRMMQRLAQQNTRDSLRLAARLLVAANDRPLQQEMLNALEESFTGRSLSQLPDELITAIASTGGGSPVLKLRQGNPDAIQQALATVADSNVPAAKRGELIEVLGEIRAAEALPVLLDVVTTASNLELVESAVQAVQVFPEPVVAETILGRWPDFSASTRSVAETVLASRSDWTLVTLQAVSGGRLRAEQFSETGLRKMLLHDDDRIRQLIRQQWGEVAGASTAAMKAETDVVTQHLSTGSGNPRAGKMLYTKTCGKCHRLFGEGGEIGPDLTSFRRTDQQRMLSNIINPSLELREGFESWVAVTNDGRIVTGFLADRDDHVVVIRTAEGQNVVLQRGEIDELSASKVSVMPEGLLKSMDAQQVRDLFAYLRSSQPVNYR